MGISNQKKKRTYLQNRNRPTDIESKIIITKGKGDEIDKLGDWNYHIHTTIYIINNQQNLLYSTGNHTQTFVVSYKGKESEKKIQLNCLDFK